MRLVIGLLVVGGCLAGGGALAWKGLELGQAFDAPKEEWITSGGELNRAVVTTESRDEGVTKKKVSEVRPSGFTRDVMMPLPGSNGIAVPDSARAGSKYNRGSSSTKGSYVTNRSPSRTPGQTYGLEGRSQLSRTLDSSMYKRPDFRFTPSSRKRELSSNRKVNRR